MKRLLMLGLVLTLVAACPLIGYTAEMVHGAKYTLSLTKDYTPSPWTTEEGYLRQSGGKFVFGAKNALLGVTELYTAPRDAMQHGEKVAVGIGRGFVNMLGDMVGGVIHIATFPITAVDVPLPQGGTKIL